MRKKISYYYHLYGPIKFTWYLLTEIKWFFKKTLQNSHTPFGEDILIDNLLGRKKTGFYVDIGAYDPTRFSNTQRFYQNGWTGINIEPNPDRIKRFLKSRPKDINLNIGISDKNGLLNYFRFEPESLSTFSKKTSNRYLKQGYKLISITPVKVFKLRTILNKYCRHKFIDFFSIDTEGFDFKVLKSNNWKKFKPKVICLEIPSEEDPNFSNPDRKLSNSSEKFLSKLNYKKAYQTVSNFILVDSRS